MLFASARADAVWAFGFGERTGRKEESVQTGRYGHAFVTPEDEAYFHSEQEFGAVSLSDDRIRGKIGESVEMKVYAWSQNGSENLTYDWYNEDGDWLEAGSASGDTLTIDSLEDGQFGTYTCVIREESLDQSAEVEFDIVKSSSFFVTGRIDGKAYDFWTEQLYYGQYATLSVEAADYRSENPLDYQWYQDGEEVEGANESSYRFRMMDLYTNVECRVSNGEESVTQTFSLHKNQNSRILLKSGNDSQSVAVKTGSDVTLSAEADYEYGQDLLTYQWYKGWENVLPAEPLLGETSATYTFTPDPAEAMQTYSCVISNGNDQISFHGYVSVLQEDVELNSSISGTVEGNTVTLSPTIRKADGFAGNISYQWYKSDAAGSEKTPIDGGTKEKLILENIKEADLGRYVLELSWGEGKTAEASATISKNSWLCSVSPAAVLTGTETPVTYTAAAGYSDSQMENVAYQWYKTESGTKEKIPGAVNRTLTVNYPSETADCSYSCELTINGIVCESRAMYLLQEVYSSGFGMETGEQTVFYNKKHDSVIALDPHIVKGEAADLTISWFRFSNGWIKQDCTEGVYELDIDELDLETERYKVTVSDASGQVRERTFTLRQEKTLTLEGEADSAPKERPITPVGIAGWPGTGQPQPNPPGGTEYVCYRVKEGGKAELHCKAESTEGEISYQWKRMENMGFVEIDGATSPDYVIQQTEAGDYGTYRCIVTDGNQTKYYECMLMKSQIYWSGTTGIWVPEPVYTGQKNVSFSREVMNENWEALEDADFQWMKREWQQDPETGAGSMVEIPIEASDRISGVDTNTLTFAEIRPEDYGTYILKVTWEGVESSAYMSLQRRWVDWKGNRPDDHDGVDSSEKSFYAGEGENIYLQTAAAVPEDLITYQWYFESDDGERYEEIAGATGPDYPVNLTDSDKFGQYFCKATINGDTYEAVRAYIHRGSSGSSAFKALAKGFGFDTVNRYFDIGGTAHMGVVAYAPGSDVSYQWQVCSFSNPAEDAYMFADIPGASSPDYSIAIQSGQDYGTYRCEVTRLDTGEKEYVTYGVYSEQPIEPKPEPQPGLKTPVAGVTLSPAELRLARGQSMALTYTVLPAEASDKSVTFQSSNPAVASVDNGMVTANGAGEAVIAVTTRDGAKTASCKVTVYVPAERILLLKTKSIVKGESVKLAATVLPKESTDIITWTSSNPKAAQVSQDGTVKAIEAGTAKITAQTAGGKKAVCTVNVLRKKITASKVKLNKTKAEIKAGSVLQLTASMTPSKSSDTLKWSSSNKKIAEVDANGVVTAKKPGKVKITVKTSKNKKAVCQIQVTLDAQSVKLNKTALTLKTGASFRLKAIQTPKNATGALKWTSSAKKIASVDKKGKVKALKKGRAIITVKTKNGKQAKCKVTVK